MYFFPVTWRPLSPGKLPEEQHTNHQGPRSDSSKHRQITQNPQIPSDVHTSLNGSQNPYIWGSPKESLINLRWGKEKTFKYQLQTTHALSVYYKVILTLDNLKCLHRTQGTVSIFILLLQAISS